MRKFLALIIIFLSFASPASAASGSISVASSVATVAVGDTFTVRVRAASGGAEVNTIGADISYPADKISASSVGGSSVITLFVTKGVVIAGKVSIQGGIMPALALADSAIGTITFKALAEGTATISVASSSGIYLNDGQGTDILAGRGTVTVTIAPKKSPPPVVAPIVTPILNTNTNTPLDNKPVELPTNAPPLNVNVSPIVNAKAPVRQSPMVIPDYAICEVDWWFPAVVSMSTALIIVGLWFLGRGLHGYHKRKKKLFSK